MRSKEYRSLIFLRALSPIHAGAGRGASEHVDLPVQRDEFGFPCIWASSLKGALRGSLTRRYSSDKCLYAVVGPPPARGYKYSSAANFLDARLLLIPARSLKGVWTSVTSPHMLGYLATYLEALGIPKDPRGSLKDVKLPVASSKDLFVDGARAVLNEMDIENVSVVENLPEKIFKDVVPSELLSLIKEQKVVVVDDDTAVELVRRSMLMQYRVRLASSKTVEQGPWIEEYLPQESILVSAIVCRLDSRDGCEKPCNWLDGKLKELKVFWLGGKETIGRGLLRMYLFSKGE